MAPAGQSGNCWANCIPSRRWTIARPRQKTPGWSCPSRSKPRNRCGCCERHRHAHSGIYQAYLDDVPVGKPIDLYNDKVDNFEYHLLDFWPEPGKYTFTLECVGKNPKSQGMNLGLESVRLRECRSRVAKYWVRQGQGLAEESDGV